MFIIMGANMLAKTFQEYTGHRKEFLLYNMNYAFGVVLYYGLIWSSVSHVYHLLSK